MLSLGGAAVVALIWVAVLAFRHGVGLIGLTIAIAAAAVLGWGSPMANGAATVWSSVTPTLNSVGSAGASG